MDMRNETEFSKAFRKQFDNDPDWVIFKVVGGSYQSSGISDIIGCYQGHYVAMELKIAPNFLTEKQSYFLRRVEKANGLAISLYLDKQLQRVNLCCICGKNVRNYATLTKLTLAEVKREIELLCIGKELNKKPGC